MSTPRRITLAAAALLACSLAVGCEGESARDLRWRLLLGDGVSADRAVGYGATILSGGCSGNVVRYSSYAATGERFEETPPELEPGKYGFTARARDAQCLYFAVGCTEVTLPIDDGASVDVRLDLVAPGDEEQACASTDRCVAGRCAEQDGGPASDAGGDASAGSDAGIDSGPDGGSSCGAHEADCAGTGECISLLTLTDCGACDVPCTVAHGGETCVTGACEVDGCDDGWEDCDSDVTTGCEAQLGSLAHCGGCNELCSLPNAVEDCVGGECVLLSCVGQRDSCDGIDSNGCEADLREGATTCGDCFTRCNAGEQCQKGICGPPD